MFLFLFAFHICATKLAKLVIIFAFGAYFMSTNSLDGNYFMSTNSLDGNYFMSTNSLDGNHFMSTNSQDGNYFIIFIDKNSILHLWSGS